MLISYVHKYNNQCSSVQQPMFFGTMFPPTKCNKIASSQMLDANQY